MGSSLTNLRGELAGEWYILLLRDRRGDRLGGVGRKIPIGTGFACVRHCEDLKSSRAEALMDGSIQSGSTRAVGSRVNSPSKA
jgi:hypothetical protein